jgi:hypothetical protein
MNLNARAFGLDEKHDLNIDPTVWGPHIWATIHTLALRADADHEISPYNNFLNSLTFLLPCNACKDDYSKYINSNGFPMTGQAFEWSVNFHNYVNNKLGKKVNLSVDEARSQWFSESCSYSCKTNNTQTDYASIILFVLIVIVFVTRWALS